MSALSCLLRVIASSRARHGPRAGHWYALEFSSQSACRSWSNRPVLHRGKCAHGVRGHRGLTYGGVSVPVENSDGSGTRDAHWRARVLGRELMQGYARAGGMPLSRVTAASLADLGYTVVLGSADPFSLTAALRSAGEVLVPISDDIANLPLKGVHAHYRHQRTWGRNDCACRGRARGKLRNHVHRADDHRWRRGSPCRC